MISQSSEINLEQNMGPTEYVTKFKISDATYMVSTGTSCHVLLQNSILHVKQHF